MDAHMYACMCVCMCVCMYVWMDGWMDGWMDWTDAWMDGWNALRACVHACMHGHGWGLKPTTRLVSGKDACMHIVYMHIVYMRTHSSGEPGGAAGSFARMATMAPAPRDMPTTIWKMYTGSSTATSMNSVYGKAPRKVSFWRWWYSY